MKTIEVIRVLTIVAFVLKSTVSMAQPDSVYIDNNTDSDTVLFAGSNEVQEKQALVLKHRNPYKFNPVRCSGNAYRSWHYRVGKRLAEISKQGNKRRVAGEP